MKRFLPTIVVVASLSGCADLTNILGDVAKEINDDPALQQQYVDAVRQLGRHAKPIRGASYNATTGSASTVSNNTASYNAAASNVSAGSTNRASYKAATGNVSAGSVNIASYNVTAGSQNGQNHIAGTLIYRCNIPPFANSKLGSFLSIWSTADKRRYLAVPEPAQSSAFPIEGFGTPGNGEMDFTFSGNVQIRITTSGWTVTSLDKIYNKNSLYGPVSSGKNLPPSQCNFVKGTYKVAKTFDVATK